MGFWDQFDEEDDREVEEDEAGEPDPDDDSEEDRVLAEAIAAAEAVGDDDWYAEDQREAYLAVARAALASKQEKAERREQAAAELRRKERAREREAERERERREVLEFRAAKKPEKARAHEVPVVASAVPPSREPQDRRREREVTAEERAARVRLANAQAAEIEAKAELMRAQARAVGASTGAAAAGATPGKAEETTRAAAPAEGPAPSSSGTGARVGSEQRPARSSLEAAVNAPVAAGGQSAPASSEDPMEVADRAALMSVGRWPPPPARPNSPFWTPDADWPGDWTLTGYDLAIFRGHLNVSQAVLAGQVGVPTIEIARAEARPKAKVRPAMQVAVRAAMDEARKAAEARRVAAVVKSAGTAVEPGLGGPPAAVPVEAPGAVAGERESVALTGADLARWRAAAGLTQRQAAVKLGVAHGTVAKAELAPPVALGERLAAGLAVCLRP
jgi:hypothetical protein